MNDRETDRAASFRRKARLVLLAAAVAAAAWALSGVVVAATRHQRAHPTRALAAPEEQAVFEYGLAPAELRGFLAEGQAEGTMPNGSRLRLTLDEKLQREIVALFRRFDPAYGVFAAMEPWSGRVVALVGYRRGGEADPWLPLKAIYPAASLFKVVTAAAALEKGALAPDNEISYRGGIYSVSRRGIRTADGRGPSMTLEEAIARSANAVFGKVTVRYVGSDGLTEYMEKFGFGERIPFALPVEASTGAVPRDEYNLARTGAGFGEVYVSPLHMAMIMSAIGNAGEMPRPWLIESVADNAGTVLYRGEPAKWRDTVKPETAGALLNMMVKTVEMGTSRRTFGTPEKTPLLQDMAVAGKTGSLSGWNPPRHFEWFAGVAPVSSPSLAVVALVVNDSKWKIKGSYVGKEAFNVYFGYPSSTPPVYRKARGAHPKALRKKAHRKPRGAAKGRRLSDAGVPGRPEGTAPRWS